MSTEFTFITQKRDKGYKFVAKQYGVVVWATDLVSGIKDLEARVEAVITQLREAGFNVDEIEGEARQDPTTQTLWAQLIPFSIKATIVAAFAAIILLPIISSFAKAIGPSSPLVAAVEHPAQFIIRLGDKADQVPPQTIAEVKLAVRKIVAKIGPVIAEGRGLIGTEGSVSQSVQSGSRPANQ